MEGAQHPSCFWAETRREAAQPKSACCCLVSNCVQIFVTPWTIARQAPLSTGFPKQEYWSGLPFPSLGDLPNPRTEPTYPALAGGFFTCEPPGKPKEPGCWMANQEGKVQKREIFFFVTVNEEPVEGRLCCG